MPTTKSAAASLRRRRHRKELGRGSVTGSTPSVVFVTGSCLFRCLWRRRPRKAAGGGAEAVPWWVKILNTLTWRRQALNDSVCLSTWNGPFAGLCNMIFYNIMKQYMDKKGEGKCNCCSMQKILLLYSFMHALLGFQLIIGRERNWINLKWLNPAMLFSFKVPKKCKFE